MKRGFMKRTAAIAALILVAAGCNPFSDPGAQRSMTVQPDGPGTVFVRRAGEEIEVTGRFSLAAGDVVRTVALGARIHLDSNRAAFVARESRVRITGGGSLEVMGGSVLADSPRHMTLAIGDVTATTSDGTLRVDLFSASAGVAAYEGDVVVAAPGQERIPLAPLYDASVTAGEILAPKPYHVDVDDDWDRLHLADVVELDEQLDRYSSAISGQLGRIRLGESYFRGLEGPAAARLMSRYVASRAYSAPDLLIGYFISDLNRRGPRADSLDRAFDLRREGGQWGVIATIMGVGSGPLVAGLEDLIFTTETLASVPGGSGGGSTGPAPGGDGRPARAGGGTGGSAGSGGNGGVDEDVDEGPGDGGESGDSSGSDDEADESTPPAEEDCANLIDCVIGILNTGLLP